MKLTINDPRGFPDTIVNDLGRADFECAGDCAIVYDEATDTATIEAPHSAAAKQLYDWLEDTAEYYRTEYVAAEAEYDAAKQLARVLYDELRDPQGEV